MMDEARRIRITGDVQGVGFRDWARNTARQIGLAGWVRNLPDGTVEAHLEGSGADIAAMLDRMNEGPQAGRVHDLKADAAEPEGAEDFRIRS